MNEDLFYLDTDMGFIEDEFEKYLNTTDAECLDFVIDDIGFALIGNEVSRVILYEKKVYFIQHCLTYYVHLHALRIYKNYEEAMENIDGDLSYFLYGIPIEIDRFNEGRNYDDYENDR